MKTSEQKKYPIGKHLNVEYLNEEEIKEKIEAIESLPKKLRQLIDSLTEKQLNTSYREGGWSVKEIVHHLADSHMHSFIRFKHTLLEEQPAIKSYEEKDWVTSADVKEADISYSLQILNGVHIRWAILLKSLSNKDFQRKHFHPERKKEISLYASLAKYAWHCEHHLAHIALVKG